MLQANQTEQTSPTAGDFLFCRKRRQIHFYLYNNNWCKSFVKSANRKYKNTTAVRVKCLWRA